MAAIYYPIKLGKTSSENNYCLFKTMPGPIIVKVQSNCDLMTGTISVNRCGYGLFKVRELASAIICAEDL